LFIRKDSIYLAVSNSYDLFQVLNVPPAELLLQLINRDIRVVKIEADSAGLFICDFSSRNGPYVSDTLALGRSKAVKDFAIDSEVWILGSRENRVLLDVEAVFGVHLCAFIFAAAPSFGFGIVGRSPGRLTASWFQVRIRWARGSGDAGLALSAESSPLGCFVGGRWWCALG
jgi:hypothetical protein